MPDFRDMLNDPRTADLLKDSGKLDRIRDAPETRRLFTLLGKSAGGDLEQAAARAAKGDADALISAIRRLMADPEGQKLIRNMHDRLK